MDRPQKHLRDYWYGKLKEAGFKDIEDVNSPREFLVDWHSQHFVIKYTSQEFFEKQRYFQMTREFLQTYKFKNKREKIIWSLHTEGKSLREISQFVALKKDRINQIINELIEIMRGL